MRMNWGNKLLISLIVFAGIMATMVTIAMRENIDLVDENYYQKEIEYQDRIDQMTNNFEAGALEIRLDRELSSIVLKFNDKIEHGLVHLFRPSNAGEDQKIQLLTDENGLQLISYKGLKSGLWRIKIEWSAESDEYYSEQVLNIP
ncbi:FixH family protein [Hyphobacterium sp. CCMP332]|nr:FixH family protein [Hyphobacterium sp. CCMP332]